MKLRIPRLDSWRIALPLAVLLVPACNDTTTRPVRTIAITSPLQWSPTGSNGTFSATAALRVNWVFRLERIAGPSETRLPLYKFQLDAQEHIQFTWDGRSNFGTDDFAVGDSCLATVTYPQLSDADKPRARVRFLF
jgi:hypothetical protein